MSFATWRWGAAAGVCAAVTVVACGDDEAKAPRSDAGAEAGGGDGGDGGDREEAGPASGGARDAGAGGSGETGAPVDAGPTPRTVAVDDGELRGEAVGSVRSFLGIPYAKPPVGDLRWRAPVENDPWTGVRDATEFGPACAQYAGEGVAKGEEDCLYLNVWAPDVAPSRPAPVLFWIHGGGHQQGASSDPFLTLPGILTYDGHEFAARGLVVVTIDYRLGPLGFLAQTDLTADGAPRGNQGLLDQQRALEWVRDNIAAFGGDPGNVTIFGESSGSVDVCNHMVSPGSLGLFHRAVSESGGCTAQKPTAEEAEAEVAGYVAALGCSNAASIVPCLRGKSVDELMLFPPSVPVGSVPEGGAGDAGLVEGGTAVDGGGGTLPGGSRYDGTRLAWWFGPVVDGAVLPDQPRTLFANDGAAHVPYLLGSNADEGVLFHLQEGAPVKTEAEYEAALHRRFGGRAAEILEVYPAASFDSPEAAIRRVTGDFELVCETHDTARRAADAGLDVYLYDFSVLFDVPGEPGNLAATHGLEIAFVWGDGITFLNPDRKKSHEMIQGYWSRFAETGDPNGDGAVAWPKFTTANDTRLQFDTGKARVVTDYRSAECDLWRTFYGSFDPGRPGSGDVTP